MIEDIDVGFYWTIGVTTRLGWQLVEVFNPAWVDPKRVEYHWKYLDGSGEYEINGGIWIRCDPPKLVM